MSNPDEVFRAHVVYMNLGTGEEKHVYSSRPYSTKGPATRSMNGLKKSHYHTRRTVYDPNFQGQYYWQAPRIDDPSDTRTDDELLPFYDAYIERAIKWDRV